MRYIKKYEGIFNWFKEQKKDVTNYYRYRKNMGIKLYNFISKYHQSKIKRYPAYDSDSMTLIIYVNSKEFIKIMDYYGSTFRVYIYKDVDNILQEYIESILPNKILLRNSIFYNIFKIDNMKSVSIKINGNDYEFFRATKQYNL